MVTRRQFVQSGAVVASAYGLQGLTPVWARAAGLVPSGRQASEWSLSIARTPVQVDGRRAEAVTVNGSLPAPLLRWREGDSVTLRVSNGLDEDTSIHWHGILLPFQMDGVPGVTFPGIRPGETFTYRFPVKQSGTYWYHSHSGLQEQIGLYGPLIIDPADPDSVDCDREHILVLSDWTFESPHALFEKLKKASHGLNFQKRTLGDLFKDADRIGVGATLDERLMWGRMRMSPTDIADVTASTYTYLVNGQAPAENWTGLFRPGERVRLRIINASAMTFFNLRIPGLAMTVVQADGLPVQPVETDEFQIGVAETYDLIVHPVEDRAYTVMCETMDRSGYARATLAPRLGMVGPVPELRSRPLLSMRDMGMADHGAHSSGADGTSPDHQVAQPNGGHEGMDHSLMHHSPVSEPHGMAPMTSSPPPLHAHPRGPGVANLARAPSSRLHEPGIGLEAVPHRALAYAQLKSLHPNPDLRAPSRTLELHLTGNMERYMWSFDGVQFSAVTGPIQFVEGERVRMTLVNDTMMAHPIHLHGMFFQLVNGAGAHQPNKHTVIVKPGEKLSIDVTADAVGDWAFHCHLLYHMHAGMFQVVSVRPQAQASQA
ncbi:MAG: copper resistance system multicopper oxidase [Pseudomonadota bacterium]|nr:copper resistance system multicopper oxidase [Pseudomonadota bacterium]